MFSPGLQSWTKPATSGDVPGALHAHRMVAVGSKLFLFGGYVRTNKVKARSFRIGCYVLSSVVLLPALHLHILRFRMLCKFLAESGSIQPLIVLRPRPMPTISFVCSIHCSSRGQL